MQVIKTIRDIRKLVSAARRAAKTVGLVPTMGALHEGHAQLIERARRESDLLVVSVFVNPLQFGPGEDYSRYPRALEADLDFCQERGVDLVFNPEPTELYPESQKTFVEVEEIPSELCGRFRPGHFRGVATVVLKLFNIVLPDRAYFGEKDAQQLRVIEQMAADLNLPVTIVPVPTVREPDGLAVSSRNRYLTPDQRRSAAILYQALNAAYRALSAGEREVSKVLAASEAVLAREPAVRKEYLEVVDARLMTPVTTVEGPVRIAGAVWLETTRLIDNLYWKGK
jgi:pantoate--beta-alanine ligase